jgi:hypothetical protein
MIHPTTRAAKFGKVGAVKHGLKLKRIAWTVDGIEELTRSCFADGGGRNPRIGSRAFFLMFSSRNQPARPSRSCQHPVNAC